MNDEAGPDPEEALWNQVRLRLLLAGVDPEEVKELDREHEALSRPADPARLPVGWGATPDWARSDAIALMRSHVLWNNEPRITIGELAQRSGLAVETCRRARMLLGLPDPGDAAVCRTEEIEAFKGFAAGMELYGEQTILHFTRVIGSALATIAEGSLSVFARSMTEIAGDDDRLPEGYAYTLMTFDAFEAFRAVPEVLRIASKLQFEQAVEQIGAQPGVSHLAAVGFVDLTGSTITTEELGVDAMAEALSRLEEWSAELAVANGGRVVKYIGDEVMFVTPELAGATEVATELIRRIAEDPVLRSARGGIAYGEALNRDGDWFGTTVNKAARLVDKARRGTLMLTGDGAADCEGAVAKGRKRLKGISERVDVWRIDIET